MDYTNYGENRWELCCGEYSGVEKEAIDRLYGLVQSYVPYILTLRMMSGKILLDSHNKNRVVVGTLQSNPLLKELADNGFYKPELCAEGYSIKTAPDPENKALDITVLQGADPSGVLYAVADYERYAIRNRETYHGYHYNKKYLPFVDRALSFERCSAPKIEHRGLWSWGHVIYDYMKYIDHMCECKLNTLILWNDYIPVNAADIVCYAHAHAVKVIWGFSWCWGEKVNPTDPEDLNKCTRFVLDTYENQYRTVGCDGIYFQAFTETTDTKIDGESISDLVIRWVKYISDRLYERYPDIWIQFGLHTTSIREECSKFSAIDSRMSIVWEDAGEFPYAYDPAKNQDFNKTLHYTKELLCLRGQQERFGAVFKGFTVLNWDRFEHQKGSHIVGKASRPFMESRTREKDFYWRYAAPYWIQQAPELQRLLQAIAAAPINDRLITALVEDGMWESKLHISVQILAELLWNPDTDLTELIKVLFHDCRDCL